MYCIYHSKDLDGFCSGAIVKKKFPEAILIGYDYGEDFPYDQIEPDKEIIMVDVSLKMEQMRVLNRYSGNKLTWIDHHVSAIKEYFDHNCEFQAVTQIGIAACEITWEHFFREPIPKGVLLLGEYDTWRNEDRVRWENEILPFQMGMRLICNSPQSFPPYLFYPGTLHSGIKENGRTILQYQRQMNEINCKKNAFEIEFQGLRAICLNGGGFSSMTFDSVYNEEKHDIMMPFQYDGKQWKFSLYTTKDHIDCSLIAKKFGGGGHKKASGFSLSTSDFNNLFFYYDKI